MTTERWEAIEALFEQAFALPPDDRVAFLATACPDDPTLCAEVASLLDASEETGPLDRLISDIAVSAATEMDTAPLDGHTVGPY
ncbi:MAG: hypothetical protein HKN04_10260, partial [Rhodothermaceae bacterium]|nr:hypothetical protein [Rhodothermaceae bacterium]